jgi:DNA-binding response OmpR family regulator
MRHKRNQVVMITEPTEVWPYHTLDEISHLGCSDPAALRARIDQLLDERKDMRDAVGAGTVIIPNDWQLTAAEERYLRALALTKKGLTTSRERLHAAVSGKSHLETDPKIVDVITFRVRSKLKPFFGSDIIHTVHGRGFEMSDKLRLVLCP